MRVTRFLMAALAITAFAGVANADYDVWFEATGLNPGATVTSQGSAGNALELQCDPTVVPTARCEWTIKMLLQWQAGQPEIAGWSNDFTTDGGNKLAVKRVLYKGPWNQLTLPPQFGPGPNLITGAGAVNFFPPFPGPGPIYNIFEFDLSKRKILPPVPGQVTNIFTSIGVGAWANSAGAPPNVRFGPNAAIPGTPGTRAPLPIIRITNVPEPATLALLGMGVVAMIRRRR